MVNVNQNGETIRTDPSNQPNQVDRLSQPLQDILAVISAHIRERGYAPSVREICEATGIPSTSTVHAHLRRLEEAGFLRRDPSKPRAMVLLHVPVEDRYSQAAAGALLHTPAMGSTGAPDPYAGALFDVASEVLVAASDETPGDILPDAGANAITGHPEKPFFTDGVQALPFISFAHVAEEIQHTQDDCWLIPKGFLPEGAFFLTSMPDDSMVNRQISTGDILLVRQQDSARSGDLVLGVIHDEAFIRTYFQGIRQIRLQAENDMFESIVTDQGELQIVGIVIGYTRLFA
ncbi:MAG: MarR family transcriptional regulator [Clostridiales bacterium]|nr:MarR family transcriptional regulator [Clostridiales bacterium]